MKIYTYAECQELLQKASIEEMLAQATGSDPIQALLIAQHVIHLIASGRVTDWGAGDGDFSGKKEVFSFQRNR